MKDVKDILTNVEEFYRKRVRHRSELGDSNVNSSNCEVTFYDVVWNDNLDSFKKHVDDTNFEILKFVQSNYFYKVIRVRQEVNERYKEEGASVFINRVQLTEVQRSPRTAHLATVSSLNDIYV